MSSDNKWIVLVSRLLEATQTNQIRWKRTYVDDDFARPNERVSQAYYVDFMDKELRLYEYDSKYFVDEGRYEWETAIRLEFIDSRGASLYEVPRVEGLDDLLEAVRFQTADIDKFLEKLTH